MSPLGPEIVADIAASQEVAAGASAQQAPVAASSPEPAATKRPRTFGELPGYARSLLKIKVPVSVQLASKKESVGDVIEIVAGAILKFDKGCDQSLQMMVGSQLVAEGEAVKIGDKFGFRVTSMILPSEHFRPARRSQSI